MTFLSVNKNIAFEEITFYLDDDAVKPSKNSSEDVGYNISLIKKVKSLSKKTSVYDTGVRIVLPTGYYSEIYPKGNILEYGHILLNSLIDSGNHNTIKITLTKVDEELPDIPLPADICQLVIKKKADSSKTFQNGSYGITITPGPIYYSQNEFPQ